MMDFAKPEIFDSYTNFFKSRLLETHRKLTILGVVLLVATVAIYFYHEEDHPGDGFNYAYVTGIAMIAVFMASLAMINKDKFKESKSKKK